MDLGTGEGQPVVQVKASPPCNNATPGLETPKANSQSLPKVPRRQGTEQELGHRAVHILASSTGHKEAAGLGENFPLFSLSRDKNKTKKPTEFIFKVFILLQLLTPGSICPRTEFTRIQMLSSH